jgi:hypothetical protein
LSQTAAEAPDASASSDTVVTLTTTSGVLSPATTGDAQKTRMVTLHGAEPVMLNLTVGRTGDPVDHGHRPGRD